MNHHQTEKICVILNPKAGNQKAEEAIPLIEKSLQSYFSEWSIEITKGSKHATYLAKQAADANIDIIAVMGGDGSCHEVVQGIMKSKNSPILALIPFGTGGDLRKSTKTPKNISKAIQIAAQGEDKSVDVGLIKKTHTDGSIQEEYFINVAGFGANGKVVERSNRWSKRFGGRITFLNATVYTSFTYQAPLIKLEWTNTDDSVETWTGNMLSCFVANAQYCGGGMKITPDNSITDGFLHLRILPEMSVPEQLFHMPKLYSNEIEKVPNAVCRTIKHLKAFAPKSQDVSIDLDGELSGILPAQFSILPKSLTIRAPWG